MERPSAVGVAAMIAALLAVVSCTSSNESLPPAPSQSTTVATGTALAAKVETTPPTVIDAPPTAVATVVATDAAVATTVDSTLPDATTTDSTLPDATTTNSTLPDATTTNSTITDSSLPTDFEIGTSVEGRPITVHRRGTPGGRKVVVIGVIHGDEQAGHQIVDLLDVIDVPDGTELWLVPTMNPDGFEADVRHNANGVDLNRNFPYNWGPIGEPGYWEYAGSAPASEPETQAIVAFLTDLQPDLTIWYHQDYNRIAPGRGRDGAVRARYAELTGVPLLGISGGTYTGVAATWARTTLPDGVAFIVELGATLSPESALVHAQAVLTIGAELG